MRAVPFVVVALVLAGCGSGAVRDASLDAVAKAPARPESFAAGKAAVGDSAAKLASNVTPAAPRLMVRDASLTLRVKGVEAAERRVAEVARSVGGDVEASQGSDLAGPNPSLSMTLRVPESRFDAAVAGLEGLGTRLDKTISTEDVTAQAVDLDARTKSLRVQEEAYRAILANARRIPDVLEIQERLTGVRTEIEQIVAQRRTLGDQAARSKIVVTLQQALTPAAPAPDPDWVAQTWGSATGALREFGRGFASLGLWSVAMLPIWLPTLFLASWAWRRFRPRPVL